MTEISFNLEQVLSIITALSIILTPPGIIMGRHFWKKSQCFTAMENKINSLNKHDKNANTVHDNHEDRLDKIETELSEIKIYVTLLLDKAEIPIPKK